MIFEFSATFDFLAPKVEFWRRYFDVWSQDLKILSLQGELGGRGRVLGTPGGFGIGEIMSQHFRIWRDKQTIQGPCPNSVWRDKQNQGKQPVFESKTRKVNCILQKNFWLNFIQTYTIRRVAILCIFLYMKSLSSEFHRIMHSPNIPHHLPLNNY